MKATVVQALGIASQLVAMISSAAQDAFSGCDDIQIDQEQFAAPPKPEMGDVSFPCFPLASAFGQNPKEVAARLTGAIKVSLPVVSVRAIGPYVNFFLDRTYLIAQACHQVIAAGEGYGSTGIGAGQKVMIEYSGPNSNKALHLGHLRNNQIGIALVRVFQAAGFVVVPVNIINDRGIAICKAMVAYKRWGEGKTPETEGVKGDHFVGSFYASYQEAYDSDFEEWLTRVKKMVLPLLEGLEDEDKKALVTEFEAQSDLVAETVEMLRLWEEEDPKVRALWQTMNSWVYQGFDQTYARQGASFDKVYLESDTYAFGRSIVMQHLEQGTVGRDDAGNIVIDLSDEGLDTKVLVRSDGTTVYITQDIGTAVLRFSEYHPLDRLVYVVASEQCYHFQVLFKMLARFGYPWADRCFHRSYGMVRLASGKMSSRRLKEGGVFLADDLMDHLHELASQEVARRSPDLPETEREHRAEVIGLAALKYFLLRVNADKDMTFLPEESLAFEGKTGPYLLYTYARIQSILRQAQEQGIEFGKNKVDSSVLGDDEFELAKSLVGLPQAVEQAVSQYNPTVIADWVYELARAFNQFYSNCKVLEGDNEVTKARLRLCLAVATGLKCGLGLLGIETLERM